MTTNYDIMQCLHLSGPDYITVDVHAVCTKFKQDRKKLFASLLLVYPAACIIIKLALKVILVKGDNHCVEFG